MERRGECPGSAKTATELPGFLRDPTRGLHPRHRECSFMTKEEPGGSGFTYSFTAEENQHGEFQAKLDGTRSAHQTSAAMWVHVDLVSGAPELYRDPCWWVRVSTPLPLTLREHRATE